MKWLIITLVILAVIPVLWLRGGLFQEPLPSIIAAARMEWQGNDRAALGERMLVRAGSEHAQVIEWKAGGWNLVEQLGSGYVLTRDGEKIILVCQNWSSRYRICSHGV